MAFYRTERPILIAQGIVDYDQQCALLDKDTGTQRMQEVAGFIRRALDFRPGER
jgi:hypothetical protein